MSIGTSRFRSALRAVCLSLLFVAWGCSSPSGGSGAAKYRDLNEVEKASLISKLRKESVDQLALFDQSDAVDLDALKRHVELEGETTKIAPATCPNCYMRYGVALSRLGLYWQMLVRKLEEAKANAGSEEESRVLDERIEKHRNMMIDCFVASNQQFDVYFRSGEAIHPETYKWVYRQCETLGDYQKALYYLDLYVQNVSLSPEGKKNAKLIREAYEKELRRQEEAELRRELERSDEPRPMTRPRHRAEPAN